MAGAAPHYVVQLCLDAASNAALEALALKLETVPGLATVHGFGSVHHMSLAIYDQAPDEAFINRLGRFAGTLGTFTINLANIGIFPGDRNVLYLGPSVTEPLLALHRRFHETFGALARWPHYLPGTWVPHLTLAMHVEPQALAPAIDIVRREWQPGAVRLDALALVRAFPVEELRRFPL